MVHWFALIGSTEMISTDSFSSAYEVWIEKDTKKARDWYIKAVQQKADGDWECISGCECDTQKFTKEMHALCASLGDCGSSVNIADKFSIENQKRRIRRQKRRCPRESRKKARTQKIN